MKHKKKVYKGLKIVGQQTYKAASFIIRDVLPAIAIATAKAVLSADNAMAEQKARAKEQISRYEKK